MTDKEKEIQEAVEKNLKEKLKDAFVSVDTKDTEADSLRGPLVTVALRVKRPGGNGDAVSEGWCYLGPQDFRYFETPAELNTFLLSSLKEGPKVAELQKKRDQAEERRKTNRVKSFTFGVASYPLIVATIWLFYFKEGWGWTTLGMFLGVYALASVGLWFQARSDEADAKRDVEELDYKIDLQRYKVSDSETRAENVLRLNEVHLRRYYDSALRQNGWTFPLGILCIVFGAGISIFAIWLVGWHGQQSGAQIGEKIVTATLGAVGTLLTNYIAVIFLKMHTAASTNMATFHSRLVDTNQMLFGNLVASKIGTQNLREETLSKIAINISKPSPAPAKATHKDKDAEAKASKKEKGPKANAADDEDEEG